jgi:hypothetical protein
VEEEGEIDIEEDSAAPTNQATDVGTQRGVIGKEGGSKRKAAHSRTQPGKFFRHVRSVRVGNALADILSQTKQGTSSEKRKNRATCEACTVQEDNRSGP